uniref:Uncharacterized protein n=1 Tax=Candidatus Kentrum sp. TC TaxID=2126339 RepID=A0A450Z552_9GAMM|nr:MAG: hypothetical protein BECKTC1821E_GA0114239_11464 [Candidatus Kentron sp. TC]
MIPHARKVLYATTTNENHGVLLQIMPLTPYIGGYFHSIRQSNTGHFAKRGIRLFRGRCIHARTYPPPLRAALQRRNITFHPLPLTRFTNKLINGRHLNNHFSNRIAIPTKSPPTENPFSPQTSNPLKRSWAL